MSRTPVPRGSYRAWRGLLGGNYERVVKFAEWLEEQPARQEILARLSRSRR